MKSIQEILDNDSTDIVRGRAKLSLPCEKTSIEEGEEIANKLFRVLTARNDGYGLAANQIGIRKQVCVLNVKKPLYLINPRIVDSEGELIYYERCLSFPGEFVRTKRRSMVVVECDNYEGQLYFDVSYLSIEERNDDNLDVVEIVAIQHEIDHVNGKTMFDSEDIQKPVRVGEKYGRNDKVTVTNGTDTKIIKYKNFEKMSKDGFYILED